MEIQKIPRNVRAKEIHTVIKRNAATTHMHTRGHTLHMCVHTCVHIPGLMRDCNSANNASDAPTEIVT